MSAYDTRPIMLDAGRVALTLRALHRRDDHYPFLGDAPRRRAAARARAARFAAWLWRLQARVGRRRLRPVQSPVL